MKYAIAIAVTLMGIGVVSSLGPNSAYAQRPARYQPPAGPTITPYLDYFRQDVGLLDPYHRFIEPQRQLRGTIEQLRGTTRQQQRELRNLEGQVQQLRQPEMRPTGIGAGFMNYSHYYQMRQPGRR